MRIYMGKTWDETAKFLSLQEEKMKLKKLQMIDIMRHLEAKTTPDRNSWVLFLQVR